MSEKEDAEKYINALYETKPFDENKGKFNFYLIKGYKPECELYKGIALYCYSKDLVKKSGSCPNDYVVVVKEKEKRIRSSAYMNVISINSKHHTNVFAHEFGHSFAYFAEEYTPAKIPKKAKNCFNTCDKFEGEEDECMEGCSKGNYFRSIDQGVMKTLKTNRFGNYNEQFIQKRIDESTESSGKVTGKATHEERDCSKESYLLVGATISEDGKFNLGESESTVGCKGKGYGSYSMQEGNYISKFSPEYIFTAVPGKAEELSGETYPSDKTFYLAISEIKGTEEVVIKNEDEKTVSIMKKSVYWCLDPNA